jgi:hypothetical protein
MSFTFTLISILLYSRTNAQEATINIRAYKLTRNKDSYSAMWILLTQTVIFLRVQCTFRNRLIIDFVLISEICIVLSNVVNAKMNINL